MRSKVSGRFVKLKSTHKNKRCNKSAALIRLKDLDALNPFPKSKNLTISNLAWRCYLYTKLLKTGTIKLLICLQKIRCFAHSYNRSGNPSIGALKRKNLYSRHNEAVPLKGRFFKKNYAKAMSMGYASNALGKSLKPFLETCYIGKVVKDAQEIVDGNILNPMLSVQTNGTRLSLEHIELLQCLEASKSFCPSLQSKIAVSPLGLERERNCSPLKFLGIHTSPWSSHTPLLFSPSIHLLEEVPVTGPN
ncbi:uncharacterized protein [Palaemon carinicauda]|uniref:uncharacterized protein n=1 Tax=Palaemon carinicauda TaxID=392227 RepID=UPI0035B6694A